jgi:hypothetical protein
MGGVRWGVRRCRLHPMNIVASTKRAMPRTREIFDYLMPGKPTRWPSQTGPLFRWNDTSTRSSREAQRVPARALPITLPSWKGGCARKRGCRIRAGPIRGNLMRVPIGENLRLDPIAASLLNSFGNEVAESVAFGDCFSQVGTPLDERIRKLLDGLQHQVQLVFAVVA